MKLFQIKEYDSFISETECEGYTRLSEKSFRQLENFVLSNNDARNEAVELMGLSARKGVGKVITAKNYVGMIALNDGTRIEILPKVYSASKKHSGDDKRVKKLLVEKLRSLRKSPFKKLQMSEMNLERMNIFEIFIRMFIDEVLSIVKRGLRCNYESIEENSNVFKGKLIFHKQLRYNLLHKERSYVSYDMFSQNRAENKILKSALIYLFQHTGASKNKNDIKKLLNIFSDVDCSVNYDSDFSKCINDRNTRDYVNALRWSYIFLKGKSFTSYSGFDVAFALLFPMDKLFESYVARLLTNELDDLSSVSLQDSKFHLFEKPVSLFKLRPDIVVNRGGKTFILDTKWKILSDSLTNYGISQADIYQMYVYQKKYQSEFVTLLYPLTDKVKNIKNIEFNSDDNVKVKVRFIDLFDVKNSISFIAQEIMSY